MFNRLVIVSKYTVAWVGCGLLVGIGGARNYIKKKQIKNKQ
jgi:hypothetical protein